MQVESYQINPKTGQAELIAAYDAPELPELAQTELSQKVEELSQQIEIINTKIDSNES